MQLPLQHRYPSSKNRSTATCHFWPKRFNCLPPSELMLLHHWKFPLQAATWQLVPQLGLCRDFFQLISPRVDEHNYNSAIIAFLQSLYHRLWLRRQWKAQWNLLSTLVSPLKRLAMGLHFPAQLFAWLSVGYRGIKRIFKKCAYQY